MSNDNWLYEDGLKETLSRLQDKVRNEPANAKHRIFLFQLLAILGDWDRAVNQLNVLKEMAPETIPMVVTYREAIRCEKLRSEIFAGKRSPVIFGEPEEWTALLLESLRLTAGENFSQAEELRSQAFETAPTTAGTINGQPFTWIADADSRLGPIIEAIIDGRYVWVPFHRVRQIDIEEPADLRDSVWMPAQFVWANGGELVGLIPARYPETELSEDDQLMLSRKTEWIEASAETFCGRGQKMLATDAAEYGIMDIRQVSLETEAETGAGGSDMDSSHA